MAKAACQSIFEIDFLNRENREITLKIYFAFFRVFRGKFFGNAAKYMLIKLFEFLLRNK